MKPALFSLVFFLILTSCSNSGKQQVSSNAETSGSPAAGTDLPLQERYSTSYMFTGNDPDVYSANLPLRGHALKIGDELEAVNSANVRVRFSVEKISVDNNAREELKTGETGLVELKRLEGNVSDLNGDFYFVDKGATYPTETVAESTVSATSSSSGTVSLILNDKPWTGSITYQGALFYKGGVKMLDASGKPYFQLAFKSTLLPDDRQFTISVRNFSGAVGAVPTNAMEVLLSGSETGDSKKSEMIGYKPDPNYANYSVDLSITKWEMTSADVALMSATFAAKLKGVMGSPDAKVTDGKIENVQVTVYTKPY